MSKIVMVFARMSPPTIGHALLVNKVHEIGMQEGADHIIFLSATHDNKKNPLPVDRKLYWANKMFLFANIIAADKETCSFIHAVKSLSGKYRNLLVVAGSDRVEEYSNLLKKYNGKEFHFSSISVVSAGERDPDSEGATGMSATKMRDAASRNDLIEFSKGLPTWFTYLEAEQLMKEVREGLEID